jgi:hypothetical protein
MLNCGIGWALDRDACIQAVSPGLINWKTFQTNISQIEVICHERIDQVYTTPEGNGNTRIRHYLALLCTVYSSIHRNNDLRIV